MMIIDVLDVKSQSFVFISKSSQKRLQKVPKGRVFDTIALSICLIELTKHDKHSAIVKMLSVAEKNAFRCACITIVNNHFQLFNFEALKRPEGTKISR